MMVDLIVKHLDRNYEIGKGHRAYSLERYNQIYIICDKTDLRQNRPQIYWDKLCPYLAKIFATEERIIASIVNQWVSDMNIKNNLNVDLTEYYSEMAPRPHDYNYRDWQQFDSEFLGNSELLHGEIPHMPRGLLYYLDYNTPNEPEEKLTLKDHIKKMKDSVKEFLIKDKKRLPL